MHSNQLLAFTQYFRMRVSSNLMVSQNYLDKIYNLKEKPRYGWIISIPRETMMSISSVD